MPYCQHGMHALSAITSHPFKKFDEIYSRTLLYLPAFFELPPSFYYFLPLSPQVPPVWCVLLPTKTGTNVMEGLRKTKIHSNLNAYAQ